MLIVSMSSAGDTLPSTCTTFGSEKARTTWQIAVGVADVGQERVAPALALGRAADQAGDVDERHRRRDDLLRVEDLGELVQPRVGQPDHADVGLDRGERVVRREHVVLGQRVEERALADVGQADDADGECHIEAVYGQAGEAPAARRSAAKFSKSYCAIALAE